MLAIVCLCVLFLLIGRLSVCTSNSTCQQLHSRQSRYLGFPDKSNLALTITLLKPTAFMNGVNTLHEIDVYVPLPKNPHSLLRKRRDTGEHHPGLAHRVALHADLAAALDLFGLEGETCLKCAVCEANQLSPELVKNSFLLELISTILRSTEENTNNCKMLCPFSIFHPSLFKNK